MSSKLKRDSLFQADHFDIGLAALSLVLSFGVDKSRYKFATGFSAFDENSHIIAGLVAIVCFGIAVPRTHLRSCRTVGTSVWQPFEGGVRFVTLQSISWTLFGLALFGAFLSLCVSSWGIPWVGSITMTQVWIFICALGFLAEVIMVISIYNYTGASHGREKAGWNHFGVLALLLTVFALLQCLLLEAGISPQEVQTGLKIFIVIFITSAVALTHMLVGRLYHNARWKLYQPFAGGWRFICIQILGWTSFAVAILAASICTLLSIFSPQLLYHGGWILVGCLGLLAEASMIASIPSYTADDSPNLLQWTTDALIDMRLCAVTLFVFNVHFVAPMTLVSALFFLEFSSWLLGVVVILPSYFMYCELTNESPWDSPKLRSCFLVKDIQKFFRGRVISSEKLDENKQYIFGFHPHGTLTATALWCHNSSEWRNSVLNQDLVTLAGSQVFYLPILREFVLGLGGGKVTRKRFSKAMEERKSVLLVPGGIAEMKFSNSTNKEITVVTSHKGFVRFALKYGAHLVPVFSFGETQIFDSVLPSVQKMFFKYLGIPFPLFFGRFIQIPRSCKISVVVGSPIKVEKKEDFTEEDVDKIHREYFDSLHSLFEKHKVECGHEEQILCLKDFVVSQKNIQPIASLVDARSQ